MSVYKLPERTLRIYFYFRYNLKMKLFITIFIKKELTQFWQYTDDIYEFSQKRMFQNV